MAQFYTTGYDGTDLWAWRINPGGTFETHGSVITLGATHTGTHVVGYTPVNGVDNIEVLVKFSFTSDVGKQGIVSLRYSGHSEATTRGYTLSGTVIGNAGHLAIDEGSTGYAGWVPWNYVANVIYWARFRIHGNTLYAKLWEDGRPEPAGWTMQIENNIVPFGEYSGLHHYRQSSVNYYQVSFGTDGDSAPMYRDCSVAQHGSFSVNKIPETATVDGYGGGYGGVAGAYGQAFLPTAISRHKDLPGKFAVRKASERHQLGKFRIKVHADKSCLGKFRIKTQKNRSLSGLFRVVSDSAKYQSGKFSIRSSLTAQQVGRFAVTTLPTRCQHGEFTVCHIGHNHLTGKFSVKQNTVKTITGVFSVHHMSSHSQSGHFRLYGKNTLPEAFVERDIYKQTTGNYGDIDGASIGIGIYRNSVDVVDGTIEEGSIDRGSYTIDIF